MQPVVGLLDPVAQDEAVLGELVGDRPKEMAAAGGSVWVVNEASNNLIRIDPDKAKVVGSPIEVGETPVGLAYGAGSLWVSNNASDDVTRIRP